MFHPRWGDLPVIPDTESGIAAIEREQITKPRPLEISGSKLHQPNKFESLSNKLNPEQCAIDPLTLHSIQLIQHAKKLNNALVSVLQQDCVDADFSARLLTPIPTLPEGVSNERKPGDVQGKDGISDFVDGKKKIYPEITRNICRQLLTKSVAAVCAHAGFDTASQHVLETLVDIVHDHNTRMCKMLRVAVDREALTGSCGFVDVVERVFHEIGLGSVTSLHTFYQTRIVDYHQHLLEQCQDLELEYERMKTPEQKEVLDSKIKVKEEVVSEIKFPVNEGEVAGEHPQTPPPLEELHGALQTMEKAGITNLKDEESMKWIPGQIPVKKEPTASPEPDDEIINISNSPDANLTDPEISRSISSVSLSDTMSPSTLDNSHSSKPPKKKKKKVHV